ncbi:hypothetical protein [Okeania sp. SIO1I7]|uniref:hypothetical protein n=1 Tax=Okeania sp. SIO1I7 TaxID=2607772 RepID=UPI0013FA5378|nr:hypothetical protein [Okeania sp. SIO1I7]NET30350.1 hypothetical protein [Okeania sp. SIO1I7]
MNVQDLLKRYGLNSRTSLYKRLNYLEMELAKNTDDKRFATPGQLKLLDQLHDHIKAGGSMATFALPSQVDVVSAESEQYSVQGEQSNNAKNGLQSEQQSEQHSVQPSNSEMLLESLVGAVIQNMNPPFNPLQKHLDLIKCEEKKILLTTKEVEEIIGRKPRKIKGESYGIIGGWKFIAKGRSGNQILWQVEQLKV